MLWTSNNRAAAHRRRKTDRDIVERPIASVLLESGNEIARLHPQSGIEHSMFASFHHQLYVRATDVDDESLLHRTPRIAGFALLAQTDSLTESLENSLFLLSGSGGRRPAFDNLESTKPEQSHAGEF